ncbi:gas vesicle protein GvpJ [Kribbella sp.]|uniref:gas vesicle protein GvpJ n=1 Tax=Kribbella sp. TaxID=1871183 RepID=UPI002D5B4A4B|nr:gas vesicle protein GvpJ [Kribbella sp.]HZX05781.1 gas vesicle protein GvpJ [Kribbella sp.]
MTVSAVGQRRSGGYLERPAPSSLADVIDTILDKGLVIDAYVRVSLVGIELVTIDARIVIASVDTYLRFAEATNRLDLYQQGGESLPEAIEDMQKGGAKGRTRGVLSGAKDAAKDALFGDDDEDEEQEPEEQRRPRRRPRQSSRRRSSDE